MLRVRCLRGGSRGAEAVHYIGSRVRSSAASGPLRDSGWGPRGGLHSPVRPWRGLGSAAREGAFSGKMQVGGWMELLAPVVTRIPWTYRGVGMSLSCSPPAAPSCPLLPWFVARMPANSPLLLNRNSFGR